MQRLGRALWVVALALLTLWATAALWIDGPANRLMAGLLAAAVPVGALFLWRQSRRWGIWVAIGPALGVLLWWLQLAPRQDRQWTPEVAELPRVEQAGNILTVRNVRHFGYGATDAEATPGWETRTFDLAQVTGADLLISFWGPTLYGHTILSFHVEGQPPLAISIETRKEVGESYSALLGFFRQFELYYVVADERDVVGVRTRQRGEQVRLLHLDIRPQTAQQLLLRYAESINALAAQPAWYNALTSNCTTTIERNANRVAAMDDPYDWRLLANGHLDERLREQHFLDTTMTLDALRRVSDITARAQAADGAADFSQRIRAGIPGEAGMP
ncbi:MAG: DUF4105 domain-containing protein [Gemmatimonadaceae bacterium]